MKLFNSKKFRLLSIFPFILSGLLKIFPFCLFVIYFIHDIKKINHIKIIILIISLIVFIFFIEEYLDIKKVIAISVMYGIYCGIFHNLATFYLFDLSLQTFITDSFAMFFGDMTGSFILLTILASQRHRILHFLDSRGIT